MNWHQFYAETGVYEEKCKENFREVIMQLGNFSALRLKA
jgi:hypothetical protein